MAGAANFSVRTDGGFTMAVGHLITAIKTFPRRSLRAVRRRPENAPFAQTIF